MIGTEIAVTGYGCVSPLGNDTACSTDAYLEGSSSCTIKNYVDGDYKCAFLICPIDLDIESQLGEYLVNRLDRCSQLALLAVRQAWEMSGLAKGLVSPERVAVIIGTGIGGQDSLLSQHLRLLNQRRRGHPLGVATAMPNAASAQVAIEIGATGGAHTPVSACASGAEAIALGRMLLQTGDVDVVVAGGTESALHPLSLFGFREMRALANVSGDPKRACKPFGLERSGFVLGEGAGVVVLERLADAKSRNCKLYAQLLGAGITNDAHHLAAPDPEGRQAARAISKALKTAQIDKEDVTMVSAHATGTVVGDLAEARALHRVFGRHIGEKLITAPKAGLGHLLGAAGAVESVLTIECLRRSKIPVSINSDPVDPSIELNINTSQTKQWPVGKPKIALKNTFGFGGHNVSLLWCSP